VPSIFIGLGRAKTSGTVKQCFFTEQGTNSDQEQRNNLNLTIQCIVPIAYSVQEKAEST